MDQGYVVKLQKVERPTNRSYYVNFPVALAEAMDMRKGEEFSWIVEDKNTLIFKRKRARTPRTLENMTP
jgi:antitoxin component of MazEF toxin-antitoxin module